MKLFKAAGILPAILLCWVANGYTDRLYTWTDAKGVTHITQDPPPDTAKAVDTIDYTPQPSQTVSRSTASNLTHQQTENPNLGTGQTGSGSGGGFASGDAEDDVQYQYECGPYRQTLRRYERRGEWLDNPEPGKKGELPPRAQPRGRKR